MLLAWISWSLTALSSFSTDFRLTKIRSFIILYSTGSIFSYKLYFIPLNLRKASFCSRWFYLSYLKTVSPWPLATWRKFTRVFRLSRPTFCSALVTTFRFSSASSLPDMMDGVFSSKVSSRHLLSNLVLLAYFGYFLGFRSSDNLFPIFKSKFHIIFKWIPGTTSAPIWSHVWICSHQKTSRL